jgi:hypothetical protein
MPIFPDIFSTQELTRLRQELADRDSKIRELTDSHTRELQRANHADTHTAHLEQLLETVERANREATDRARQQAALNQAANNQASAEILRLKSDLATAIELCTEIERERDAANVDADQFQKTALRLQTELANAQSSFRDRNAEFSEREARLQAKSEKLMVERQAFQLQAQRLHAREQAWRVNVEPRLRDFEAHQALEAKRLELKELDADLWRRDEALRDLKKDLDRRNCSDIELSKRELALIDLEKMVSDREATIGVAQADLERELAAVSDRKVHLDLRAEELSQFQSRVDEIEENLSKIAKRERQLAKESALEKAAQKASAIDLREKAVALRRDERRLNSATAKLDAREALVAKQESQLEKLRTDRRDLRRRLKECEDEHETLKKQFEISRKKVNSLSDELSAHADRISYRDGQIAALILERDAFRLKLDECNRSQRASGIGKTQEGLRRGPEKAIQQKDPTPPTPPQLRAESPLTAHGYRVGATGLINAEARRAVLKKIIALPFRNLQKVGPDDYMAQWGEANSRNRIWCIAHQLSWNINFQGAKESLELARKHWLEDLRWLTKHYKGRIPDSHWPTIPKQ